MVERYQLKLPEALHRGISSEQPIECLDTDLVERSFHTIIDKEFPYYRRKPGRPAMRAQQLLDLFRVHEYGVVSLDDVEHIFADPGRPPRKARRAASVLITRLNKTFREFRINLEIESVTVNRLREGITLYRLRHPYTLSSQD